MIDKEKTLKLLSYINTPMSKESILILYNDNNIKYEKCELYGDYIQSLLMLVLDTYMGDDITSLTEQKNHFKWCWNTNVKNFEKEDIYINSPALYKYFLDFMIELFYTIVNKEEVGCENVLKLWAFVFDYNNNKSKSDIDTLIEVYRLFEKSIKK